MKMVGELHHRCTAKPIYFGVLFLQRWAQRLVLKSEEGNVMDARYLREGEVILPKRVIELSCHLVVVGCNLDQIQTQVALMPQRMDELKEALVAVLLAPRSGEIGGERGREVASSQLY
jgi:hypothetical protein